MDNYYDVATGEWVTDWTRYEQVLRLPRFSAIAEHRLSSESAAESVAHLLAFLAAVPDDTVHYVGSGPLEELVNGADAEVVTLLEAAMPGNPRLQRAVLEVNLARGTLSTALEARLVAAFGPRFQLLAPDAG